MLGQERVNPFLPMRTPIFSLKYPKNGKTSALASSLHISSRSINQLPATTKEGSPWRPASLPSPRSTRHQETEDAITVVVIAGQAILARAMEDFTICGADGQNCDGAILLLRCAVAGSVDNAVLDEVQHRPGDKLLSHWRVQADKKEKKGQQHGFHPFCFANDRSPRRQPSTLPQSMTA